MRQAQAKEFAEKALESRIKPKQIRGRCCLFVYGNPNFKPDYTNFYGVTWDEACSKIILYLATKKQNSATLQTQDAQTK